MESTSTTPSPVVSTPPAGDSKIFLWGVSLLGVAVFAGVIMAAWLKKGAINQGVLPDQDRRVASFQLTERSGRIVDASEFRDKFLVVNFVHTGCSISCAIVNQRMAEVQKLVAGQDDVQLLSISVDPGTDTPSVLTKFAAQYGADPNRWLFLTGEKRVVYQLIEMSFLSRDTNAALMEMPGGFRMADHIALVDRDGRVRRYFPGMKFETPAAIMSALDQLRATRRKY